MVVSCSIEISSLLVIPGFIILCVNLFWLSIVISFLCARYRDCKQIVDAFVLILFYISPVIWMPTALSPKSSVFILAPNPAYHLISIVRSPLLGMYPSLASWLISSVMGCLGMVFALCVFGKYRRSLSYWL